MNRIVLTGGYTLRQSTKVLVVGFAALLLSACGFGGPKVPEIAKTDSSDYSAISSNLVDALSQYTRLNPLLATVQVTPADSRFEAQVQKEMTDRGYKLEKVKSRKKAKAANVVTARVRSDKSEAPLYLLSIGELSAERRFAVNDGATLPASELVIRGGEARSVVLNDSDIFTGVDPQLSSVSFPSDSNAQSDGNAQVAANDVKVQEPAKPVGPGTLAVNEEDPKPAPVKWNMYDTLQSNYVAVFDEYEDVDRSVLVFPNDSLRLGDGNKQIIEEYVAKMDPETDVLSVIGCSHGTSELDNGNSLLALGRANRVKEAFLFSGIEHEHVMDEGCWAPQAFDEVMPRRGVVLTLKRRKSS